jgi:RNA polymerase sigma factor (sigma-70 family)
MAGTSRYPLSEFDDPATVAKLIAGDKGTRDRLYEEALPALSALVRKVFGKKVFTLEDSLEIAGDAIMSARESVSDFDPEEDGTFSSWLVTIAFNKARDRIKWRKSSVRDPLDRPDTVLIENPDSIVSPPSGTATPQPAEAIAESFSEDLVERLRAAAGRLPAAVSHELRRRVLAEKLSGRERLVLIWKIEGFSDTEIASKLDITKKHVQVIRNRALNKWAEELERAGSR